MKKRAIVLAAVLAVLAAILYVWGPSAVPLGQEPLLTLSSANVSEFEKAFDREADAPRLVLLLSPT